MQADHRHPYVVVDVFTDTPLEGNPVAVFTDGERIDGNQMQRVARELNLSETVFLFGHEDADEDADARVRIFTPAVELPFAGHPVLGTAFVVGERSGEETVRLRTGAGVVPIELRRAGGRIVFGEMSQPIPTWESFASAAALLEALGVERSQLPVEIYDNGPRHTYVALEHQDAVTSLAPDMNALGALGAFGVSCFALQGRRVHLRMFGPGLGVNEDPATGSAAGPLAVHLARHGQIGFGESITISQGSEILRPSALHACAFGVSEAIERVTVGGSAVPVAEGRYRLL